MQSFFSSFLQVNSCINMFDMVFLLKLLFMGVLSVLLLYVFLLFFGAFFFRMAAKRGYRIGQIFLGSAYYEGRFGVSQDYAQAVEWFQKAAEQGEIHAQYNLGMCYLRGHGVPQDLVLGYVWLNCSIELGENDRAPEIFKEMPNELSLDAIKEVHAKTAEIMARLKANNP